LFVKNPCSGSGGLTSGRCYRHIWRNWFLQPLPRRQAASLSEISCRTTSLSKWR